jgi:hypothetical protein
MNRGEVVKADWPFSDRTESKTRAAVFWQDSAQDGCPQPLRGNAVVAFAFPLIVAYTILGAITGIVVGRRLWGGVGAACLGTALALVPAVVGFLGFIWFSFHL